MVSVVAFCQADIFDAESLFNNHSLSDQKLKEEGVVIEALPDTKFKVQLNDGRNVLAYLSGKMRMNYIKVMIGDKVTLEMSPDGSRGRIIYRK